MAVLSLAMGIGANTAIYSAMYAILLRTLPVQDPGKLVILHWSARKVPPAGVSNVAGLARLDAGGDWTSPNFSWPAYKLIRDHNDVFSALFAYKDWGPLDLGVNGQAELRSTEFVSGNYFRGLGVVPAAGRLIDENDDLPGARGVAVLSYPYWRDQFGGEPKAIGQTVRINGIPFTIVGVSPPGFFGVAPGSDPVLYIPIVNQQLFPIPSLLTDSHLDWTEIMGRLRPGVTTERAQTELAARFREFALAAAANDTRADLPSLWLEEGGSGVGSLRRQYSKPLFILMAMVIFILAITCANIASLLLTRATARRREIAVRLSLGANRVRILRQLITEGVELALGGGTLGVCVALAGNHLLFLLLARGRNDFYVPIELDWRVLASTIALTLGVGILFGLAPAIEATRVDITPALKETQASAPRAHAGSIGFSRMLLIVQIALSLLLVLGAEIFVRTLANLHSVHLGFNIANVLTFRLDAEKAGYKDAALKEFFPQIEKQLSALPGVQTVTETNSPLPGPQFNTGPITVSGSSTPRGGGGVLFVGPSFFEAMQHPIVLGRAIDLHDVEGAPLTVVINQFLAKEYFPDENPIGRHIGLIGIKDLTIVGIAKNAHESSLRSPISAFAYLPYLQHPRGSMYFEMRTAGDPIALVKAVRGVVHNTAPDVPIVDMMTESQHIENSVVQERTFADLCTAFSVLALLTVCIGVYGSVAYAVARRTNEIGIRMALGAKSRGIIWMVLREVLALAAAGLSIGFIGAWTAVPVIKSFLFGVTPTDSLLVLSASGILIAVLVLAGYVPAWRASRINPLTALRHE